MADLYWPGDERAGDHFSQRALVTTMLAVEADWLGHDLDVAVAVDDLVDDLAAAAEAGGNPVIPLVRLLREAHPDAHRGLTSQDVVDSALMRMAAVAVADLRRDLATVGQRLADLAEVHRDTPMVARTLTQHAVPTTFGFRVAAWLTAVLDADEDLARLSPSSSPARRAPGPRSSSWGAGCLTTSPGGTRPARR
ncbi:MAG: hypothetical protein KDB43_12580 [Nocardioidaceae bacterium]|nr:hypothetical protein [Nocardioidaceae bacterium]